MIFTLELIIHYALFILIMNPHSSLGGMKNSSYWLANTELPHSTKQEEEYYILI